MYTVSAHRCFRVKMFFFPPNLPSKISLHLNCQLIRHLVSRKYEKTEKNYYYHQQHHHNNNTFDGPTMYMWTRVYMQIECKSHHFSLYWTSFKMKRIWLYRNWGDWMLLYCLSVQAWDNHLCLFAQQIPEIVFRFWSLSLAASLSFVRCAYVCEHVYLRILFSRGIKKRSIKIVIVVLLFYVREICAMNWRIWVSHLKWSFNCTLYTYLDVLSTMYFIAWPGHAAPPSPKTSTTGIRLQN